MIRTAEKKGTTSQKEHRHCVVCGKMTSAADRYLCSPECEDMLNQHQTLLKKRKKISTMFFIFFIVAIVVMLIVYSLRGSAA